MAKNKDASAIFSDKLSKVGIDTPMLSLQIIQLLLRISLSTRATEIHDYFSKIKNRFLTILANSEGGSDRCSLLRTRSK